MTDFGHLLGQRVKSIASGWCRLVIGLGWVGLVLILTLGGSLPSAIAAPLSPSPANPSELAQAVEDIEALDALRSGLAVTLEGRTEPPTLQTMQEVCRPVGMKAMELSQTHGWQVKQIAAKYRNPDHAPDNLHARMAIARFEQDPELMGFWDRETVNDQPGTRYYRRINVEASCLACHGAKGDRPQFVQDHYPQDLAYDFNVGDLRGMYAVFIPDVQQAIQNAVSP